MYQVDSNDNTKMIPKASPIKNKIGHATTPAPYPERAPRPTYILVNKVGNYSFAYESGSLATYTSGSQVTNAAGGPIKLDIQPVAWVSKGGAAGDITFVYRGDAI